MPTSKKDFEWAADYVRDMRKRNVHADQVQAVESAFSDLFAYTSARFDDRWFREACHGD